MEAGVFITRAPLGFVDGPNVYTYVRQNPWTAFDPQGLYNPLTDFSVRDFATGIWAGAAKGTIDLGGLVIDAGSYAVEHVAGVDTTEFDKAVNSFQSELTEKSGEFVESVTGGDLDTMEGRRSTQIGEAVGVDGKGKGLQELGDLTLEIVRTIRRRVDGSLEAVDDTRQAASALNRQNTPNGQLDNAPTNPQRNHHSNPNHTPVPKVKESKFGPKIADEEIPGSVPKNWTADQIDDAILDCENSVSSRRAEVDHFIDTGKGTEKATRGHLQRIGREQEFLNKLKKKAEDS